MIFGDGVYLATPYRPFAGAAAKNDSIMAACVAHPDRFMVSERSGDPRVLVARLLTSPDNAVWETWRGGTFCGIILLDRIVPCVEARLQFVFFDDELASKAALLNDFVERCFGEFQLHRLTFEAPAHMTTLTSFARRKLGFTGEAIRSGAYHDGTRWHDVYMMGRVAP
jgi:hypothetical protein